MIFQTRRQNTPYFRFTMFKFISYFRPNCSKSTPFSDQWQSIPYFRLTCSNLYPVVRHSESEYDHDIMGLGNGAVRPSVADEANTGIETPPAGLAPVGGGGVGVGVGCALSSGFLCPAFLLCRVRPSRF